MLPSLHRASVMFLFPFCVLYFLLPCHPTFSPFGLWAFLLFIKIPCVLLDSRLCCQVCLWLTGWRVAWWFISTFSWMCLWGTSVQELFGNQYNSWKACDSVPCAALVTGLMNRDAPERWHGEACRAVSPRWFPQVSLPLAFYFQHIYMASFLSTVLTFRN